MNDIMKWNWQINLIIAMFFLSSFILGGYQLWHLLGALVFAVISISSFIENSKKNNQPKNDEEE